MTDTSFSCSPSSGWLDSADPHVFAILDEYLARIEAGESPNSEELIARHPELADELRNYFHSIDFLRNGAAHEETTAFEDWSGRSLGDYRILREVGRGGMGVVYEARQISLERRVALKVLPFAAVLDQRQITRFSIEAQAAAQLQHPHIVPVHGVGCERGVHFYSMQFIDGRSLDLAIEELREFGQRGTSRDSPNEHEAVATTRGFSTGCSTREPSYFRSVARLGIEAAEALQHAHQCGVVHRDVKPSNLLLDRNGKVWVTDFGLARFPTDANLTQSGAVLGTIRYMSPEQAAGESDLVDQRTDIYSLGATLYELLTLQSVFDADNHEKFLRQIDQVEPEPPKRINPAVPVDLETIILKALAKARHDRYPNAQAMADDLRRFLDGTPIAARRPSLFDRAGKWAARHKTALRVSMALLLIMFTGACSAVLMIAREQHQKAAALQLYEENFIELRDELGNFGVLVADELEGIPGTEPLREKVLNRTLDVYERLIDQASHDPSLQADLAIASFKAGELRERIGQSVAALEAYQRAVRLFSQLHRKEPANSKLQRDLATCHNGIALLTAKTGDFDMARAAQDDAVRLQQELAKRTRSSDDERALASMMHNLGALLRQIGDMDQARSIHESAIAIQERLSERAPGNDDLRRDLAMSYNNLSFLDRDKDLEEAIEYNERALNLLKPDTPSKVANARLQADLALSLNNAGALYRRRGDLDQARDAYGQAVDIYARLAQKAPAMVDHRRDLAVSQNNLGSVLNELHRTHEAESAFEAARDALAVLVRDTPNELSYLSSLGGVLNNLALLQERSGRTEEATASYELAIEYHRSSLAQAPSVNSLHKFLDRTCENYARLLRDSGNKARAAEIEHNKRHWLSIALAKQREY